jgi:exodeoxyribonuclease-5
MTKQQFYELLVNSFQYQPTQSQWELFEKWVRFLASSDQLEIFLLNGYAGTGKTSSVNALVAALSQTRMKTVLLAPTGRAAKVLSAYTSKNAFTIHKHIYFSSNEDGDGFQFQVQSNKYVNTLFIVDEASMIASGQKGDEWMGRNLLDDVMQYVYSGEKCKLLFIGDQAQLPPVGETESVALQTKYFETHFGFRVHQHELTDVVRQSEGSGILFNATWLRQLLELPKEIKSIPTFRLSGFKDVKRITMADELEDKLQAAYSKYGDEEVLIICRSNKQAIRYNFEIKARIKYSDDLINTNDLLMVVKNNYHWLDKKEGFLANGEVLRVERVGRRETMYGFDFAQLSLVWFDGTTEKSIDAKVLLSTMQSESTGLSQQEWKSMLAAAKESYGFLPKYKMMAELRKDPYLNALQVKLAYAVTCHKAQGGQWKCVFIDQGYITEEMINHEYIRWLYTAVTRATEQLYLVNFHDRFFEDGDD